VGTDALAVVESSDDWIGEEGVTLRSWRRSTPQVLRTGRMWNPACRRGRSSASALDGQRTFDYFVEVVMNPLYVKDATADAVRRGGAVGGGELQLSEDDNVCAGVEGDKDAIGYFGFAYSWRTRASCGPGDEASRHRLR